MSTVSKIEWTDRTWNPIRGCSIVSEGCRNCYAMRQAHRFDNPGGAYEGLTRMTEHGPIWTGKIRLVDSELEAPLRWKKPSRVFVNSMSDLFHEDVPERFRDKVFAIMALTPRHTYQILTKRPERMYEYLSSGKQLPVLDEESLAIDRAPGVRVRIAGQIHARLPVNEWERGNVPWPLSNVWLGVSVENQATTGRIYHLLKTPAAIRFLSLEPLLEDLGIIPLTDYPKRIDWVIVGGESGPGARPCNLEWIRSIVRQCKAVRVLVFVKQLGAEPVWHLCNESSYCDPPTCIRHTQKLRDRKGGDPAEWPEDFPREFPR